VISNPARFTSQVFFASKAERERIASAVATNARLFQKLAAQRILLGLILSFVAGVLSVLVFQHVLPLLLRSLV